MSAIGTPYPRLDSKPKVAGSTRYAGDLYAPGLLHARLVLSPFAHATIRGIDREAALAVPGVVAVLAAADLPTADRSGMRQQEPLARSEVLFAGQPVAIVVAESEAAAQDGVDAVVVDYDPLEPVLDLERAARRDSPLARVQQSGGGDAGASMHSDAAGSGGEEDDDETLPPNVVARVRHREGDIDAALAGCDAVVRGTFRNAWVHQSYIEPQTAVARPEPGGGLHVETATQASFYTREQIARLYQLPLSSIRVTAAPLGGAFGSKFFLIEPLVAGAALALRQPVRLAFTRSEDLAAGQPAPAAVVELEIGGRRSGELVAIRSRILLDSGAFSDWSMQDLAAALVAGPYRWETWAIDAYGVYTNRTPAGAYRGPCGPQTAFAIESLVDELAAELGVDPLELRERSGAREGDVRVDGTTYGLLAVEEVMEAVRQHPLWQKRDQLPPDEGIGVAAGIWIGATMSSSAVCRMEGDGGLTVVTGAVDMTGVATGFAAIAAETFGVPMEDVRVVTADTESAPWAPPSGGSVMTFSMGRAVERAAEAAKERLLDLASQELEIAPSDLEVVDGEVRAVGSPDTKIAVKKLARKVSGFFAGHVAVEGHGSNAPPGPSPSVAAHVAHVKVDRETGEVKLLGYVVAQDCGRALNPALVDGQMRGGAAQGIGWALLEEMVVDEAGQLLTGSFMSYAIPHAEHIPPIDTVHVEVPSVDGPYGAKGIGEAGVIPAPGAIANAIAAAVGVRPRELPMTPPRIWRALEAS